MYPKGVVKDMLVQVEGLFFLADFYVIKIEDEGVANSMPILLEDHF